MEDSSPTTLDNPRYVEIARRVVELDKEYWRLRNKYGKSFGDQTALKEKIFEIQKQMWRVREELPEGHRSIHECYQLAGEPDNWGLVAYGVQ